MNSWSIEMDRLGHQTSLERNMSEVGAYEAKTHLPRLLKQVEAGEIVTITRNGRAIARLAPGSDTKDAVSRMRAWRSSRRFRCFGRFCCAVCCDENRGDRP